MIIDSTINLGNILTIVFGGIFWLITLVVAWTKFGNRLDMLSFRLQLTEESIKDIATILKKFTDNEAGILLLKRDVSSLQSDYASLNKTVEDLRRGDGWITKPRRESVNGEY